MQIREIQSPFINEVREIGFFEKVQSKGTPIIENTDDGVSVHFIYFGDDYTNTVHVLGSFPGWDIGKGKMIHVEGTRVWLKSFKTDYSLASTYYFSINDTYGDNWGERFNNFIEDPLNPKQLNFSNDEQQEKNMSVSFLTVNKNLKSVDIPSSNPDIIKQSFKSKLLNNQRNLWIYDPFKNATDKNLLIIFDGSQFTEEIPVPNMVDLLHKREKLAPTVMVSLDSPDRFNEFRGKDSFNRFLVHELFPWIKSHYNISHNPKDIALCGASLGGLASFYAATMHPNLFGNVLAQSGSLNWLKAEGKEDKYWAVEFLDNSSKLPLRIYMNSGLLEEKALKEANLLTFQMLSDKNYDVKYEMFNGGHDILWWRETFISGLEYLFSKN